MTPQLELRARIPAQGPPTAVSVADFNGDGKPDLVVCRSRMQTPSTGSIGDAARPRNSEGAIGVFLGSGDGHFFGRDAAECAGTLAQHPNFISEDPAFFHLYPPSAGVCAAGLVPVYRVFSNCADANHRYTTERAVRDEMKAKGWLVEGDGPDAVVMCAPA